MGWRTVFTPITAPLDVAHVEAPSARERQEWARAGRERRRQEHRARRDTAPSTVGCRRLDPLNEAAPAADTARAA